METQILSFKDSFLAGSTAALSRLLQFLPTLLGAAIILVIGWAISRVVARWFENALDRMKIENVSRKSGITQGLQNAFGPKMTFNHSLAVMAKWFMRLIFIQAAANILSMPQLTTIINNINLFIPNLAIALVILTLGAWSAQFAGRLVEASVSTARVSNARFFSLITRYGVNGFAVIAAIHQLGIATSLINILFVGLVGSLALAVGLAFGLGGQSVAQDLTRSWYDQGRTPREHLKSVGSGAKTGHK